MQVYYCQIFAVGFAACDFLFGLFLRDRNLWSLKNSPRQLLEVLASLGAFVIFVFHLNKQNSPKLNKAIPKTVIPALRKTWPKVGL